MLIYVPASSGNSTFGHSCQSESSYKTYSHQIILILLIHLKFKITNL